MILKIITSNKTSQVGIITLPEPKNEDNLYNVRHETSRHFRKEKRGYLKDKINEIVSEIE
jgi:hypothetical protein